jgi:hypothetical protein
MSDIFAIDRLNAIGFYSVFWPISFIIYVIIMFFRAFTWIGRFGFDKDSWGIDFFKLH